MRMNYAGFWKRLGAFAIDFLLMMPLMYLVILGQSKFRYFDLYWALPGTVIGLWFSVYLVKRYGGTPGKLLMRTRVVMLDGSPVTWKAAMLRHSILLLFSLASMLALGIGLLNLEIPDSQFFSMGFMARSALIVGAAPSWYEVTNWLLQIWTWSEFLVILLNKKRRALHDYLAGTVVVNTQQAPT